MERLLMSSGIEPGTNPYPYFIFAMHLSAYYRGILIS